MKATAALLSILVLAFAALPLGAGDYFIGVGLSVLMYVALTQSWTVLSGMTGYVSLGHVVFYGLGGYGVGLALANQILELHGATLEIESVLHQGTTMRVRMPLCRV